MKSIISWIAASFTKREEWLGANVFTRKFGVQNIKRATIMQTKMELSSLVAEIGV